jgi:methionine-rich copper-binding protein CopC
VTLLDPSGRTVYTWRRHVGAGATIVQLAIPAAAKPGRYTVVWRAVSGSRPVVRRIIVRAAATR